MYMYMYMYNVYMYIYWTSSNYMQALLTTESHATDYSMDYSTP